MNIIYSNQSSYNGHGPSIFLAGPTPRSKEVKSWRPEALNILNQLDYQGTVLIPEYDSMQNRIDYLNQVEWEYDGLSNCTTIALWVPRRMETMPALTTNVEFGYWLAKSPKRIVYGRPNDACNIAYLDWLITKEIPQAIISTTLNDILNKAINHSCIGDFS